MSDRAALVEKVARETCDAVNGAGAYDETLDIHQDAVWKPIAIAAIDLIRDEVLEEAAKVCDRYAKHDWKLGEGFRSLAGIELAAEIRALKEKPNG